MSPKRRRLDTELVRRGMASSRGKAQCLVASGKVRVSGSVAMKSARLVDPAEALLVVGEPARYVSRGGQKLEAALTGFGINPSGVRAIDIGASTGGFTDCLLQHGAVEVVAIDVGRNQLHERLRSNRRVVSLERTDVRNVDVDAIGGPARLVVVDLSFISCRRVINEIRSLASAELVILVKPQFEAGKAAADRGRGVIRHPEVRQQAVLDVVSTLRAVGSAIIGVMVSPITGSAGNAEFFIHADVRPDVGGLDDRAISSAVAEAVEQASRMS